MKRKNSEIPADFPITKCPDGEAAGARDLATWGYRRAKGQSGVRPKKPKEQTKAQKKRAAERKIRRKKYRVTRRSYKPATTERADFSDMNVYDTSIPPWDENQVILERR